MAEVAPGAGEVIRPLDSPADTGVHPGVGPERFFQDRLDGGRFMIQRSRSSGAYVFYPRVLAPGTGTDDLDWIEPSGIGEVYSTTVVEASRSNPQAYNIAIVELAEGPRLLTRVVGIAPHAVAIGMAVRAKVGMIDGKTVVLFAPAETGR